MSAAPDSTGGLRVAVGDDRVRFWSGFKFRLETVLAILGIAGGAYALLGKFLFIIPPVMWVT